ncbi:stage II sporulation protein P [Effusibacillus pohliae]|uniref:stage II sporulation protein P n=1 Tax=Effusibacillus pohliae TaxID=232270 RepID=UPI000368B56A|nr:stage II sporulation protein P [Effusibacillus pohliae]
MNRHPRQRPFRSMTVHVGTGQIRTVVITMCVAVAVLLILISAVAVQLLAVGNQNSVAMRLLHSVSNQSLSSIMRQEIPMYVSSDPNLDAAKEKRSHWSAMLFYLFSDIDVGQPVTMLGGQIPAMAVSNFEPLTKDHQEPPGEDKLPPQNGNPDQPPAPQPPPQPVQTDGKPLVYIYHTHNRESFLPELKGITDFDAAYDRDKNITLVGERLQKSLKEKGVAAIQTKNDYWFKGKDENEYDLSRKTVQDILKKYDSVKMLFDIHRDSFDRDKTTFKWNGQDVARVSFIIGGSNPNWQQNSQFALKLHNRLEQLYPGLSRGVHKKLPNPAYDTKYNQDLSPNAVLIEIGGPQNSLEEAYRAADLLANVIAELAKEDQAK